MRKAYKKYLNYEEFTFPDNIYLNFDMIIDSISYCYNIIDSLDSVLYTNNSGSISELIEPSNLSSLISNLICKGLANSSNFIYECNKPNTYPDLINKSHKFLGLEVKTSFNKNLPKGHHPKDGYYIIYRYCLTDEDGNRYFGTEEEWNTISIWEVRFGYLNEESFTLSNTENDSGKTAIIKKTFLDKLQLLYYNPFLDPYKSKRIKY